MYKEWLYFFNSPLNEISIKGKETKQPVVKEWLDDGSMKISGNKPSNWSITIQKVLSSDISTLQYAIENDKINAKYLFQRSFKDRNIELFNEGEKLYNISEKNKKDLLSIKEDNDTLLKNIHEKIFQNKRNLYLINLKKPIDLNKVKKISSELEISLIELMNILKSIEERENNYILKPQSILRSGPSPDPPIIKKISIKTGGDKLNNEKNINTEDDIKYIEGIISDTVKNKKKEFNEKIINENIKSGGYIKVITL